MKQPEIYTDMQRVILASPINGAPYHGDLLPETSWQWPADTWLRKRLAALTTGTIGTGAAVERLEPRR